MISQHKCKYITERCKTNQISRDKRIDYLTELFKGDSNTRENNNPHKRHNAKFTIRDVDKTLSVQKKEC